MEDNDDLVFEFSERVFKVDEEAAAKTFMNLTRLRQAGYNDRVLEFLLNHGPTPTRIYLEFLKSINHAEFTVEREALLATLYLQEMTSDKNVSQIEDAGRKDRPNILRLALLRTLQANPAAYVVDSVEEAIFSHQSLFPEKAAVYAKRKMHDQVLRTLVYGSHDYQAAQSYCLEIEKGVTKTASESLLLFLVRLYLDGDERWSHEYSQQASTLMKMHADKLDLLQASGCFYFMSEDKSLTRWKKILQLVPDSWSVDLMRDFLTTRFRQGVSERHNSLIIKALAQAENLKMTARLAAARGSVRPMELRGETPCALCRRPVVDPTVFVRLPGPDGHAAHLACLRRAGQLELGGADGPTTESA
ncbi:transforming growth factor, beta receptor associated protein 1 [Cladochytrium tenue]|nr:transforming growth factor, beta receptor associated protein 1 [Cladochytrium tenue]